jgi:hypothetical protein
LGFECYRDVSTVWRRLLAEPKKKTRGGFPSASRLPELRPEPSDLFFEIVHHLLRKFSVGIGPTQLACFKSVAMTINQRSEPLLDLSVASSELM